MISNLFMKKKTLTIYGIKVNGSFLSRVYTQKGRAEEIAEHRQELSKDNLRIQVISVEEMELVE